MKTFSLLSPLSFYVIIDYIAHSMICPQQVNKSSSYCTEIIVSTDR